MGIIFDKLWRWILLHFFFKKNSNEEVVGTDFGFFPTSSCKYFGKQKKNTSHLTILSMISWDQINIRSGKNNVIIKTCSITTSKVTTYVPKFWFRNIFTAKYLLTANNCSALSGIYSTKMCFNEEITLTNLPFCIMMVLCNGQSLRYSTADSSCRIKYFCWKSIWLMISVKGLRL